MSNASPLERIECAACGAAIDCAEDTPTQRSPCPRCGGTGRSFFPSVAESGNARDGLGVKIKRPGERRPHIEDLGVPSYSRDKGKIVFHERIVDRENDRYREKVTDYETGEVIHQCEESLSQHRGHGSAKAKKVVTPTSEIGPKSEIPDESVDVKNQ